MDVTIGTSEITTIINLRSRPSSVCIEDAGLCITGVRGSRPRNSSKNADPGSFLREIKRK